MQRTNATHVVAILFCCVTLPARAAETNASTTVPNDSAEIRGASVSHDTQPSAAARPRMLYGDATRHGQPFAKDPCVIRLGGRYLMYYSMAPSTNPAAPKGWAVGIAESRDLIAWNKVGEMLPEQDCEKNGLVNGKAILLGGKLHVFYNFQGNRDKGKTWFLSCAELDWKGGRPAIHWDSARFPTKRPGPAAHHADGID
jgi:hypothetical protein